MLVQRLDHDCGPVLHGWIRFLTAPLPDHGNFGESQDKSAQCISGPFGAEFGLAEAAW
jgi:hypothetical protein